MSFVNWYNELPLFLYLKNEGFKTIKKLVKGKNLCLMMCGILTLRMN